VLGLVWLALAAFTTLAQRFLGWRLAIGLIGGAGVLFTIGLLVVAGGSVVASSLESRRGRRRQPLGELAPTKPAAGRCRRSARIAVRRPHASG